MLGLVVHFHLKEGGAEPFDNLVKAAVPQIEAHEPGTLIYSVHAVEGQPDVRVFYELYRDRAAFEEHERQEHVRRFHADKEQYLTDTRVEFLELQSGAGIPGAG